MTNFHFHIARLSQCERLCRYGVTVPMVIADYLKKSRRRSPECPIMFIFLQIGLSYLFIKSEHNDMPYIEAIIING